MAEILEGFSFRNAVSRKHPWDVWLDGQCRRLSAADFGDAVKPAYVGAQVRLQAKKRQLKVQISIDDKAGTVVLQATRMTPEEIAEAAAKEQAKAAEANQKEQADGQPTDTDKEPKQKQQQPAPEPKRGRKGKKTE
jgi:hypothetical protein